MTGQEQISQLLDRIDQDGEFATSLEDDPLTALRGAGFDELVVAAEQERDRIAELVDRIYRDRKFRETVERDPSGELNKWGLPELAIQPVLVLAGAPDEVVERADADVEAHLLGKKPASVAAVAAVLGTLAFAQQASAASNPAVTAQVSNPAVTAQVSNPAVTAQVSNPAVTAQVSRTAATAQISAAARAQWHGVQLKPARVQVSVLSLLRATSR